MGIEGDEWEIPIPELARRLGMAQRLVEEVGPRYGQRENFLALQAILNARVSLEAAERVGAAAIRADEAAIVAADATVAAAEATRRAAEAAEGTKKATIALVAVTALLVVAEILRLIFR